jgi:hypothetical protein
MASFVLFAALSSAANASDYTDWFAAGAHSAQLFCISTEIKLWSILGTSEAARPTHCTA